MFLAVNGARTDMQVHEADTFGKRLVGLIGKSQVVHGLYFSSCSSIHTFFMRCAIDIVALDADGRVVAVRTVAPFRTLLLGKRCRNLMELPAGTVQALALKAGDILSFMENHETDL
jgi:uncharacterized membrane protein (UPF0127 family)